ncbi:polysaccharide deacetylase family protein [Methanosarcina sp. 2.H.A.1B.4]|uniref:polysaccharide deacetylase family protein n=1 Tax=Methanosarcina sp. 2.H.A.1B.4 TaxID=1483600 RepID=UPI0006228174|nr:polysaccharide deacetylase family protein [Methanosarcina sp. 2.H.A.1B.4]KKG07377.1 hypothetical protein EO92_14990 [Methanosarcina sp. 2.H.A.1B.4]
MTLKSKIYSATLSPIRFTCNLINTPAIILIYHRVTTLENDPQLLAINPDNFYKQIEWLKKNYNIISIEELSDRLKDKKLPERSIVITFDDGYADNYLEALPILETLEAPATFFVTTGIIDTDKEFWWDDLERVFLSRIDLPPSLSLNVSGNICRFDVSNQKNKLNTYNELHPILKFQNPSNRDLLVKSILDWSGLNYKGRKTHRTMTQKEVIKLSKSEYATIGAHTKSHSPLSILSKEEQRKDIISSKEQLENWTNNQIKYFSYPFGCKNDYNKNSIDICKELNFDLVCSNYYGQVHSYSNIYELPRCLIRDWDLNLFKSQINKYFRY